MSPSPRRTPLAPLSLGLAAVALGHALQVASGHVHPQAIAWLGVAIVLTAAAVALPEAKLPWSDRASDALLGAGLLFAFAELWWKPPGAAAPFTEAATLLPFHVALALATLLAAVIVAAPERLARYTLPSLLLLHFALGVWLIRTSPSPLIDVYAIHRQSLDELLRGGNPYALTFANIYPTTIMYGAGQLSGARLNFGYCYPPIDLLMALPGHLLFGDYRYSFLGCISLSGLLVGGALPGRRATVAAGLLLFTPRVFYVIEHGWTEPVVALLLCATLVAALRRPRLLVAALGLLLVSKQYAFFLIPPALALLLAGRDAEAKRRIFLGAALVGAAVTLPFLLWSPRAFGWDVVALQFHSPFRRDALSFLAWLTTLGGPELPSLVGFLAAVAAVALSVVRGARTVAGFGAATALTLLIFFAFNKQAFCNYYYLCIVALCAAAAAWPSTSPSPPPSLT